MTISVVVQSRSHIWLFATPWTAASLEAPLPSIISWSLLRFMSIESMVLSNYLILCYSLLWPLIFPSIRVFSSDLAHCIRWQKYWSFSFNISPSREYSGLLSFRVDWFDFLAAQGTPKSLPPAPNWKASILWHSTFFMVQLLHLYMTTEKITSLTIQIYVSKVMSLLFNTLSRFVIASLPRSKCLWISWLQSPSRVMLEPKKIKLITASIFFSFYLPWNDGTRCHDFSFLNVEFQASFLSLLFHPHQEAVSSLLSVIRVVSSAYLSWYFSKL